MEEVRKVTDNIIAYYVPDDTENTQLTVDAQEISDDWINAKSSALSKLMSSLCPFSPGSLIGPEYECHRKAQRREADRGGIKASPNHSLESIPICCNLMLPEKASMFWRRLSTWEQGLDWVSAIFWESPLFPSQLEHSCRPDSWFPDGVRIWESLNFTAVPTSWP